MKDFLNYYYFILPDKIRLLNQNYYFSFKNQFFAFYKYNNSLENIQDIFNLNIYISYQTKNVNKIILNREGNILTKKNNSYYVLVLLEISSNNIVTLKNVLEFQRVYLSIPSLNRSNWYFLWSQKIDNLEYISKHFMKKYLLLYHSLSYYIGLTENAISYLRYLKLENHNLGVCHKRVGSRESLREFYNPLNFVIDYKVRDIAEYFKSLYFDKKIDVKEIVNLIKRINFNSIDIIYFYIRMLYPSYYFDLVDEILKGNQEEKVLNIIEMQENFEYLLYEIYLIVKSRVNIVGIEWINKKFANL